MKLRVPLLDAKPYNVETRDVDLPGPVEKLLSIVYGTPMFLSGSGPLISLKYNESQGLTPIKHAIAAIRDDFT